MSQLNAVNYQQFYAGFNGINGCSGCTSVNYNRLPSEYMVPEYSTLTHGTAPSTGRGYFQIGRAYGEGSANCTTTYFAQQC